MNPADRHVGFSGFEFSWIFIGYLLASSDLVIRLRDLQFISSIDWLRFALSVYAFYLILTLIIGNAIFILLKMLFKHRLSNEVIQKITMIIFITLIAWVVLVRGTRIEFAPGGLQNILGLVIFLLAGGAMAVLFSTIILFSVRRHFRTMCAACFIPLVCAYLVVPIYRPANRPEPGRAETSARHPNLIIILIDALRADHLGCYGSETVSTPSLDRFAGRSTMFRNVISQSSWTKTSMASLMSSMLPSRHGVFTEGDVVGPEIPLLSSLLRSKGITTAAFVGNPWMNSRFGFDRGYSLYFEEFDRLWKIFPIDVIFGRRLVKRQPFPDGSKLFRHARNWIERYGERHFFVYIHLMDVHDPYLPPPPFDTMYLGDIGGHYDRNQLREKEKRFRELKASPDSTLLRLAEGLYSGGISYEDSMIGDFLGFLEARGLFDNTLIVVTADHGEEFLEHGGTTHGRTLYNEVIRVPMLIRYPPAFPEGTIVNNPVKLIDIVPTITDVYGIEAESTFGGKSFIGDIDGPGGQSEPSRGERIISELHHGDGFVQSVCDGEWKLIRKDWIPDDPQRGILELYHLGDDPSELVNLADVRQEKVQELIGSFPAVPRETDQKIEIPERLLESLKALGYIQQEK